MQPLTIMHKSHSQAPSREAVARQHGFTAIELMVVVSIVALLAALAAPSFTPLIETWRVRQATESLQSSLFYARSESIKRGGQVVIQKIPNNTDGCSSATSNADWDCGWIVCHDIGNNGSCDAGDTLLQRVPTPSGVQVSRTAGGTTIQLNRWGLVDGPFIGFSLVPLDKPTTHSGARGLCMSSGGRIRIIPPQDIPCNAG